MIMKITLCGSIAFYGEMLEIKKQLEALGHEIKLPPAEIQDENGNMIPVKKYYDIRKSGDNAEWIWNRKKQAILAHFQKIGWSDAILVLNYDKNNITGYVGANTLMEIGIALYLEKKTYFLNEIPEMHCTEEIRGANPIVINSKLKDIS